MDVNSLSHARWECKYHIVFAPKFRRKVAYGELKRDIANILSMLCKRKGNDVAAGEPFGGALDSVSVTSPYRDRTNHRLSRWF